MSLLDTTNFDRVGVGTTRDRVYLTLREAIISTELAPGRKLSENELANELGISRTPVREALARLRDERLVAIVPQLGTFVTLISPEAVADAEFVREALECAAIARATAHITTDALEELQQNLAAQEQACASHSERNFDRLDEDLHHRLCDASGHAIAWVLSRRANGHLDRIRRLSLPEPDYMQAMLAQHRTIVAAVAAGNAAAAEAAMRDHLRAVAGKVPDLQKRHPDFFE